MSTVTYPGGDWKICEFLNPNQIENEIVTGGNNAGDPLLTHALGTSFITRSRRIYLKIQFV